MSDSDDTCALFDPEAEVPKWFWDAIEQGKQDRNLFQQICEQMSRETLIECDRWFADLAGWFVEEPFRPPPPITSTTNSLEETGWWVVSQGKHYFLAVWQKPELFWKLVDDEVEDRQREKSYYGVAYDVWTARFPGEDMP